MSSSPDLPLLGVLASGRGSNLEAILDAVACGRLAARVAIVISDQAKARALEVARGCGVTAECVSARGLSRSEYDAKVAARLKEAGVQWVALAGFMRIVTQPLLDAFPDRIVNIHPALLPAFPGLHAQRQALEAGVRVTGCTVHLVDAGVDTGPIVMQRAVPVLDGDTEDTLSARVLDAEHRTFARALQALMSGELALEGRRLVRRRVRRRDELPRRCLLSVHDKRELVPLARALTAHAYELISTGGTAKLLREAGLPVTEVAALTGFPECLTGRVKTLQPAIHAGLLARPDLDGDRAELDRLGLDPIQLVVANLYPFEETVARGAAESEVREEVDIGGVTLLRAAAKNAPHVGVVVDPADYARIIAALEAGGGALDGALRAELAAKAFRTVARYDAAIAAWASAGEAFASPFAAAFEKVQDLRYGENPHQTAAFFRDPSSTSAGLGRAKQLKGKELSYNNILDADGALAAVADFTEPTVAIIKHSNPCGLASAETLEQAFRDAYACDPLSAFGGIIGTNRPVTEGMAAAIVEHKLFLEIIVAPGFEPGALERLAKRQDLRLLEVPAAGARPGPLDGLELRGVRGGLLVQSRDTAPVVRDALRVVTRALPSPAELDALVFAFRVAKAVKSNAIVLVQGRKTVGIGAGQMSRVDSVRLAASKAGERAAGSFLASDAFFPFPDGVEEAARSGARAVIQPGGSKNDAAVVDAANRLGIAMVFTGQRHFRH